MRKFIFILSILNIILFIKYNTSSSIAEDKIKYLEFKEGKEYERIVFTEPPSESKKEDYLKNDNWIIQELLKSIELSSFHDCPNQECELLKDFYLRICREYSDLVIERNLETIPQSLKSLNNFCFNKFKYTGNKI